MSIINPQCACARVSLSVCLSVCLSVTHLGIEMVEMMCIHCLDRGDLVTCLASYQGDAVGSHFGHTLGHSMRMPSKA